MQCTEVNAAHGDMLKESSGYDQLCSSKLFGVQEGHSTTHSAQAGDQRRHCSYLAMSLLQPVYRELLTEPC